MSIFVKYIGTDYPTFCSQGSSACGIVLYLMKSSRDSRTVRSCDSRTVSRGEKGILAHPQRPPNFNEIAIFVHFFLLKPTENKITPKKLLTHPDRTRSHPRSHVDCVFPCSNSTENKVISKIPFYVCDQAQLFSADFKHTFSSCDRIDFGKIPKISNSSSIGGVGDFRQNPLFSPTRQEER